MKVDVSRLAYCEKEDLALGLRIGRFRFGDEGSSEPSQPPLCVRSFRQSFNQEHNQVA